MAKYWARVKLSDGNEIEVKADTEKELRSLIDDMTKKYVSVSDFNSFSLSDNNQS